MIGLSLVPLWYYNTGTIHGTVISHYLYMGPSNIAASIELTYVAFGGWEAPSASTQIMQYKFLRNGRLETVDMPRHVTSNCVFVQNCVGITFLIGGNCYMCAAIARILYF